MKKMFLLLAVTTLAFLAVPAQERRAGYEKKAFLTISAGPSFPLSDFNSKSLTNDHAAFAKTGFNIDLKGGYHITKNYGVAGSLFYSLYSFDEQKLKDLLVQEGWPSEVSFSMDHWKYFGVVVGPTITWDMSAKTFLDFDIMTGVVSANCPKTSASVDGTQAVQKEDWATAVPVRVGTAARFQIGQNWYLTMGLNYIYMEPEFVLTSPDETLAFHQRITALNLTGGIGIRF